MIIEICPVEDLRLILQDYQLLVIRVGQALKEIENRAAAKAEKEKATTTSDFDDNVSEATQATQLDEVPEVDEEEDDVNVSEPIQQHGDNATQQSEESEHKNVFFSWAESMKKQA